MVYSYVLSLRDSLHPLAIPVFALFSVGGLMSDAVILAIIGLIGTTITASITGFVYIKLGRVETKVDGKMDALLAASIGRASAEGHAEGEQAQRDRASVPEAATVTIANTADTPVPVDPVVKP